MIVTEEYITREDGVQLVRTYSDAYMMIEQSGTGIRYSEAIDLKDSGNTYAETDEPVETEIDADEALSIILGGAV